jgi:hypothetical protein
MRESAYGVGENDAAMVRKGREWKSLENEWDGTENEWDGFWGRSEGSHAGSQFR